MKMKMKIKNAKGFVGTDAAIAIIAIIAFSGIIFFLMYQNALENVRIRKQALSTIYLTEIMENIGLESYDNITQENIDNATITLLPEDLDTEKYSVSMEVNDLELPEAIEKENIAKKIRVSIFYTIQNNEYSYFIERIKVKE